MGEGGGVVDLYKLFLLNILWFFIHLSYPEGPETIHKTKSLIEFNILFRHRVC